MLCDIRILSGGETAAFAKAELLRCLARVDGTVAEGKGGLSLSLSAGNDPRKDAIRIRVQNGNGEIWGNNPVALLIAAYRFLFELGCRFTFPGKAGERFPKKTLCAEEINVSVEETPSYRHRGVCIEGAVSEENVRDMIDYLPKVGMNSYFVQFFHPTEFFQRWYEHWGNDTLPKEPCDDARADAILARLEGEIARRGIRYQRIGHGFVGEAYGIPSSGWAPTKEEDLTEEFLNATALIDGKRGLFKNCALLTSLCFSNPAVQEKMVSAVVNFCKTHPEMDALHLWLADASNGQCECPECQKRRPADFYVQMLNEIDRRLTEDNVKTRIVFLVYCDLLFSPEYEKLRKSDRFILMFAPISRTYSNTLCEGMGEIPPEPAYQRNHIKMPSDVAENLSFLRAWQKNFDGDSFIFDYHLMWDHARDMGYRESARVLFADMQNLDKLGLDGMISCQLSRVGFPTNLPFYGMARALWDKTADFDTTEREFYLAEFGDIADDVREYLADLSRRFDPPWLRLDTPVVSEAQAAALAGIPDAVKGFIAAHPTVRQDSEDDALRVLAIHAEAAILFSRVLLRYTKGEPRQDLIDELRTWIQKNELAIQPRIDVWNFVCNMLGWVFIKLKDNAE